MKVYNSTKFNISAILSESKLVPVTEIVFLTTEPNWIHNEKKELLERKLKVSEIRMQATREQLIKLQADLNFAIENIDNMQKICDTAKIIIKDIPK
jgi:hypothetical protein